jgi:hypothetical protein
MTIDAADCNSEDNSAKTGCSSRIIVCIGWAEASDKNRATAIREATDEAKRQKDAEVENVENSVRCPTDGCPAGKRCAQGRHWVVGQQAGTVTEKIVRDDAKVWHVRRRVYVEKRLACGCVDATGGTTVALREDRDDEFLDDAELFV